MLASVAVVTSLSCQRRFGFGSAARDAGSDAFQRSSFVLGSFITPSSTVKEDAVALVPAARCGECHGKIEQEWRSSAHARADVSQLYRAMRTNTAAVDCDRCHAPLRAVSASDPTASEGVGCDTCHTLTSVTVGKADGTGYVVHPEDSVRYGPLCDAEPHYFHRMGCSPLHKTATFCAACHDYSVTLSNGSQLLVSPEYQEWLAESLTGAALPCQLCHMPGSKGEVAVGSPERPQVPSHSFSTRRLLRARALTGRAQLTASENQLVVAIDLTNTGADHSVPTGLPEHQLVITAALLDQEGRSLLQHEQVLGRSLVDSAGIEAPFYAAASETADTRIRASETRRVTFTLQKSDAKQLRVAVSWRPISPRLARRLGLAPPVSEPMIAASVALPLTLSRKSVGPHFSTSRTVELLP